jgi:uncharacterized protein YkwD
MLPVRLVVPALLALAVAAPGASAMPASRPEAVSLWDSIVAAQRVPAGWSGSTASCQVGAESPASIDATLTTVNALRRFAGLAPVTIDPVKNREALAAATMMAAAGRLSHSPDQSWPCWTSEGASGASRSNLFLGRSGAAAMVGYVDDSGVPSLGHRFWLLNPLATTFGTGSTGSTNALHVVQGAEPSSAPPSLVAWPPATFVPWELVFEDWSVELRAGSSVDFQRATVAVTVDGQPRTVTGVRPLGGGAEGSLTWRTALSSEDRGRDRAIGVTIAGATVDGAPYPIAYRVDALDLQPPSIRSVVVRPSSRLRAGRRLTASAQVSHAQTVSYQWSRSGRRIPGATKRTYRLRRVDRGKTIRCRVVASNAAGVTVTRHSRLLRIRR